MGQDIERFEFADSSALGAIKVRDDGRLEFVGTDSDDTITGSSAGEHISGGDGSDRFLFTDIEFGDDVITDFTAGAQTEDLIVFNSDLFADFETILAATNDVDGSAIIKLGGENSITLNGVSRVELHADDFQFI